MISHIGELAAFGTSVSWAIAAIIMEKSVRNVGVMAVNTLKVAFGTIYLALLAFLLNGSFFPLGLSSSSWIFLCASGVFGFVLGDYFLLNAYRMIGSRLSLLLMSLSVPLTAVGALVLWNERMGTWALAGMLLCVAGIAITVMAGGKLNERLSAEHAVSPSVYRKGVIFGILSALCMVVATLCTKAGATGVNSVSATQVRIFSSFVGFVIFALITRKSGEVTVVVKTGKGLGMIALGAVFGPFIGVGFLLFALQNADAGIVSTLSSLSPVLIIPPSVIFLKRRVSSGEVIGACLAMCGLALLFL